MEKYFIASDEERRDYYKYETSSQIDNKEKNTLLYRKFRHRIYELQILYIFDEVSEKIESCEASYQMKLDYQKQLNNITDEYNGIIKEAEKNWHFYRHLMNNIDFRSEESKKGGKDIESNVVNEALIQAMTVYIELDKNLIKIFDKLNNLYSLFI